VSEAVHQGDQPEPESRTISPGPRPARTGTPYRTTVGELMRQPVVAVEPGVGFAVGTLPRLTARHRRE
jgi:hypothetical protein